MNVHFGITIQSHGMNVPLLKLNRRVKRFLVALYQFRVDGWFGL